MIEQNPGCREVPDTQASHQVQSPILSVDGRPVGPQLNRGVDLPFNERALAIERCDEDRCKSLDTLDADAVVGREIAEAVRNQAVLVAFNCPDDMWAVTDHKVGTRVDDHPRELDDVAPRLAKIFFLCKRKSCDVPAFRTTVKGNDDDVMVGGVFGNRVSSNLVVEHHVRIPGHREREHGNAQIIDCEGSVITFQSGMMDAGRGKRLHARKAPFFTKVPRVIIGKAKYIEACIDVVIHVTRWRAKQVTGIRVAAFLAGLAAVNQHAFQVAESNISITEYRRHVPQEADTVIIGQMILGIVGAEHHIANGSDADAFR